MGIEFNRIITLLRKERGITQKQAAQELGISQAQLSHYEKGIRECGLAFVVQVADYYDKRSVIITISASEFASTILFNSGSGSGHSSV